MGRRSLVVSVLATVMLMVASPAFACGGLIGPRGSVNLLRTSTLAAYHGGIEHYITSFSYTGEAGSKFGSIVPLPGVPTDVRRGGDWTLQRLQREIPRPVVVTLFAGASAGSAPAATVILKAKVDALDITVLQGGGTSVAEWAKKEGFALSPDTPEVLDFYARRSPIFMAVRFNVARAEARGVLEGDGTPVHVTIPTPDPWVPLRILALGKQPTELIEADVFLLTDKAPSVLPAPEGFGTKSIPSAPGMTLDLSEAASSSLLEDLRSDKGMEWVPRSGMWLSYFNINTPASKMTTDLAIDSTGAGHPSWRAAGLSKPVGAPVRPIKRPVVRQEFVVPQPPARPVAAPAAADPTVALLGMLALGIAAGGTITALLRRRSVGTVVAS